ncbi:hypothetical protein V6N12_000198 [Hibiscus sabdariffa]|uniref:Uncharacterized protein n=1 Tax=Hibiscus sabdariffa TaxID=183260 RepID=A0ABR2AUF8_9ROSI
MQRFQFHAVCHAGIQQRAAAAVPVSCRTTSCAGGEVDPSVCHVGIQQRTSATILVSCRVTSCAGGFVAQPSAQASQGSFPCTNGWSLD